MAATNFTPISLYYSTTASAVPLAGNLVAGELALNTLDEKLYFKNSSGTVKLLASNATSAPVLSFSAGTTGFTPSTATTGAITLAGTLNVANGGTGQTSFTSGRLLYGNGTGGLSSSAVLTFNGTDTIALSGGNVGLNASTGNLYLDGTGSVNLRVSGYTASVQVLSTSAITFNTASSERMRIDTAGNVGIGTNSPSFKLDVTGIARVLGGSASSATFGSNQYIRIDTNANGGYTIGAPSSGGIATGYYFTSGTVSYAGGIEYENTANTLSLRTNNTIKFVIGSAGQFGIGATPSYGTSGQVLTSAGSSSAPTWTTPTGITTGKSIAMAMIFGF